jgi:hypothetical protein
MSSYKEEVLELYGLRKVLSPYGYYVCNVQKYLGGGGVSISAVSCRPCEHDEDIRRDEELLLSLPDDVSESEHGAARYKAYKAYEARRGTHQVSEICE